MILVDFFTMKHIDSRKTKNYMNINRANEWQKGKCMY